MILRRTRAGRLLPLSAIALSCASSSPEGGDLDAVSLPEGFSIASFAENVPGARSLARGARGTIFVGTRARTVYAVTDEDADGSADRVRTIATNLNTPNGVAFRDGALYVAEVSRILRFDGIEDRLDDPPAYHVVRDDLPRETHHGWKFTRFGPDGKLYVPVGAPCNACAREDERFASILRMNLDGSGLELFASGVRNTVGFDWHPETGELWFTDNGRDWLGDDAPPDELNRAPQAGLHFGFPYCHGGTIVDPELGGGTSCAAYAPPAMALGAHVAALGMRFYTGEAFPEAYRDQIFIAEHGSWNRSSPVGYRVTRVRLEGNRAVEYAVFAEGWLGRDGAWGRPVDVLVLPDGSLLVSDDLAGAIYRITYGE